MKKILAILCALIIVLSVFTTVAFAENDGNTNGSTDSTIYVSNSESNTESETETETDPVPCNHVMGEWTVVCESTVYSAGEKVRRCTLCDFSEKGAIAQLRPAEPELLSLSNTTGGILFKWSQVEGATGYRVYKRGSGEKYWTYITTVKETNYTDSRVASGNYYRYTVRAVNDGGFSTYHSGIYTKRLANPYNIKAVNNIDNVTLTWSKINGATGYRVYRRTAGVSSWTYLGTFSATSYVDKNVKSNSYYRYTVRAAYGSIFSDYSVNGALTMFVETPKPKRITTAETGVNFSWYPVSGAQSYCVYRRGAGERFWTYLGATKGTSYFDVGLKNGNYYRYTVKAVKNSYLSGYDSDGITLKYININGMIIHGRYDNHLKPGTITKPTIITVAPDNWELTIVNGGYRIPGSYKPSLTYVCGSGERLDKNVAIQYERMYNAAKSQGVYLTPCSGYRSYSTQETLFNRKINLYMNQGYSYSNAVVKAATIVMPPGSSEHNLGYAMDIVCVEEWFENTREFRWLQQNAANYGFILRYPKDKQHITKVIYEPWHWRYVGVTAAQAMKKSGLVLEEYLGVVN